MSEVRIHVADGVAFVDEVPPGVVVEIRDYDTHRANAGRDESEGRYSRYRVTAADIAGWRAARPGTALNAEWGETA